MKRRIYLETTIASYLTARPSRDPFVAAHQELTIEWWANHRQRFDLYIPEFVLREASRGDESAAARRLATLQPTGPSSGEWKGTPSSATYPKGELSRGMSDRTRAESTNGDSIVVGCVEAF